MVSLGNLPGIRWWAERDNIVGTSTCEGTSQIIVGITISAWACIFKHLRIRRRLAFIRCAIRAAATVLILVKCRAGALTSNALSTVTRRHLQSRRTTAVQIHNASGGCTVSSRSTLWNNEHRQVVTVDEADVIEVQTTVTVELEFCKRSWRSCVSPCAF